MRRLIGSLVMVVAVAGCKNQSGTLTNPFALTPDRVPPPQTRVLAPGTAQPYYPGDPVPGAAPVVGAPGAYPAAGAPGTPVYPGAAGYPAAGGAPASTLPQTSPPGGWGYGPQSSVTPPALGVGAPGGPAAVASTFNSPGSGTTSLPGSGTTRLAPREVTDAEYFAPNAFASGATQASANVAADGFRPQGSQPRSESAPPPDSPFRAPEIRRDAVTAASDASHYGAGENYASLRGQLEYWPESGAWSLRYLPADGSADSVGGRVMIDNPQVLANLQAGELVTVRGQLFGKPTETGAVQPTYRVSGVQRQRQ